MVLQPDTEYHIYNHANGRDNLFLEPENYGYFIAKWRKYILPIANTIAYCLMPNHFHFLVKIKRKELLALEMLEKGKLKKYNLNLRGFNLYLNNNPDFDVFDYISTVLPNLEGFDKNISTFLSQQFSNLFNGYTKAINKRYSRYGSLFAPNFRRRPIDTDTYLMNVLAYIHLNPIFHGFADSLDDWPYSSWHEYKKDRSWVHTSKALSRFDDYDAFDLWHQEVKNNKLRSIRNDWEM